MASITITGTTDIQDAFVFSTSPTTNFNDPNISMGEATAPFDGTVARAFIKFALTGVPAGSTINSATMSLYIDSNLASNTRDLNVYRLLRAWTETGVTWNKYDGTNDWGTAGAANTSTDREAANIGSVSVLSGPSADTEYQVTLTAAKIQEMISGGVFTNNGFLLQMSTESDDYHSFRSSEYAVDTTKIPKLVIDYTPAASGGFVFMSV